MTFPRGGSRRTVPKETPPPGRNLIGPPWARSEEEHLPGKNLGDSRNSVHGGSEEAKSRRHEFRGTGMNHQGGGVSLT